MMQSRSSEKAMLATVSRLRRLLRNADLATKLVRVIGDTKILHRAKFAGGAPGVPARLTGETPVPPPYDSSPVTILLAGIRRKLSAAPAAISCPMPSAAPLPQSESRAAACGEQAYRRRSRAVLSQARQRA